MGLENWRKMKRHRSGDMAEDQRLGGGPVLHHLEVEGRLRCEGQKEAASKLRTGPTQVTDHTTIGQRFGAHGDRVGVGAVAGLSLQPHRQALVASSALPEPAADNAGLQGHGEGLGNLVISKLSVVNRTALLAIICWGGYSVALARAGGQPKRRLFKVPLRNFHAGGIRQSSLPLSCLGGAGLLAGGAHAPSHAPGDGESRSDCPGTSCGVPKEQLLPKCASVTCLVRRLLLAAAPWAGFPPLAKHSSGRHPQARQREHDLPSMAAVWPPRQWNCCVAGVERTEMLIDGAVKAGDGEAADGAADAPAAIAGGRRSRRPEPLDLGRAPGSRRGVVQGTVVGGGARALFRSKCHDAQGSALSLQRQMAGERTAEMPALLPPPWQARRVRGAHRGGGGAGGEAAALPHNALQRLPAWPPPPFTAAAAGRGADVARPLVSLPAAGPASQAAGDDGDGDGEAAEEGPSSPSVRQAPEPGVAVTYEAKSKLFEQVLSSRHHQTLPSSQMLQPRP
eukprot:SM000052S17680  [mRNA]  locus=s52:47398:49638:- [translate_table: standard]